MSLPEFFLIGMIGGLSPGPITALLLGETFRNGFKRGLHVPLALICSNLIFGPLLTGLLYLGARQIDAVLSFMTYLGALVLIYMGIQEWRSSGKLETKTASHPFKKALMIDFINPHPYVFWLTVLAPPIVEHLKNGATELAIASWLIFIFGLTGTKAVIVVISHRIRPWLSEDHLRIILKILAVLLIGFGVKLLF